MDYFIEGVKILNPGLITFPLSCTSNEGISEWIKWLDTQILDMKE